RARPERLHVVMDLEEVAAGGAAVDHLAQAVLPVAAIDALKPRVVAHGAVSIAALPGELQPIARTPVARPDRDGPGGTSPGPSAPHGRSPGGCRPDRGSRCSSGSRDPPRARSSRRG